MFFWAWRILSRLQPFFQSIRKSLKSFSEPQEDILNLKHFFLEPKKISNASGIFSSNLKFSFSFKFKIFFFLTLTMIFKLSKIFPDFWKLFGISGSKKIFLELPKIIRVQKKFIKATEKSSKIEKFFMALYKFLSSHSFLFKKFFFFSITI